MAQTWAPWYQPSLTESLARERQPPPAKPSAKPKQAKPKSAPPSAQAVIPSALQPVPVSLTPPARAGDGDDEAPAKPAAPPAPVIMDGGARPEIAPQEPPLVKFASSQPKGTVVIDSGARKLYLVQSSTSALVYPVSVGREGFTWTGTEKISRIASWPDWHPPAEMRERDPKLPTKMTGGLKNPLGAKALYLGSSLYRIHGTSDARSVGRAASSGCFRMHNKHVVDLAGRVGVGTRVVVINAPDTRTAAAAPQAAPAAAPPGQRPRASASTR